MSLCGTIVVVETTKKLSRKRKLPDAENEPDENDDDSDEDSSPSLSYTYTHCDSSEMLQEMEEQQNQQPLVMFQSMNTLHYDDDADDDSTLDTQPPIFRWLTWRMDPIKSFSDWTIDVIVLSVPTHQQQQQQQHLQSITRNSIVDTSVTGEIITHTQKQRYRVHKNILVVESHFFQTLFHQQQQQQHQVSPLQQKHHRPQSSTVSTYSSTTATSIGTTEIALSNEHKASVFPTFLDYMYSPGSVWITPENAHTLFDLAKCFDMKRLQWLTRTFIKSFHHQQQVNNPNSNHSTAKIATPSSFAQRMNSLSRMAGESNTTTDDNDHQVLRCPTMVVTQEKKPPVVLLTDTPLLLPSDTTAPSNCRGRRRCDDITPQRLYTSTTTTNATTNGCPNHHRHSHHHHISTNSSTTITTATTYLMSTSKEPVDVGEQQQQQQVVVQSNSNNTKLQPR